MLRVLCVVVVIGFWQSCTINELPNNRSQGAVVEIKDGLAQQQSPVKTGCDSMSAECKPRLGRDHIAQAACTKLVAKCAATGGQE